MTQYPPPIPPEYSAFNPYSPDANRLRVLTVFYYIWGTVILCLSPLALIYIFVGLVIVSGAFHFPSPPATATTASTATVAAPVEDDSYVRRGYSLVAKASLVLLGSIAFGVLNIISGRRITARRWRGFSLVMAGLNCLAFPLGTALAAFTFILLSKEPVKAMYAAAAYRSGPE